MGRSNVPLPLATVYFVRYSATYLYIIKDNGLVGQYCLFKVTGQMAWFVVLSWRACVRINEDCVWPGLD